MPDRITAWHVAQDIPWVPQTQGSLNEQLEVLRVAAIRLGLYDADDFLEAAMNGL